MIIKVKIQNPFKSNKKATANSKNGQSSTAKKFKSICWTDRTHVMVNGVEYVDLGLPSGMLVSRTPVSASSKYATVKNYRLMSKGQAQELISKCTQSHNTFIGPNGNSVMIRSTSYGTTPNGGYYYKTWLKDTPANNLGKALYVYWNGSSNIHNEYVGECCAAYTVLYKRELR